MPDRFQYPLQFDRLAEPVKKKLVDEMRDRLVASIAEHTEAVVRDAIPKALAAKTGLAWKSELEARQPHFLFESNHNEVTHNVRFLLVDTPPKDWQWMSYGQLKSIWDRHLVTVGIDLAKLGGDR